MSSSSSSSSRSRSRKKPSPSSPNQTLQTIRADPSWVLIESAMKSLAAAEQELKSKEDDRTFLRDVANKTREEVCKLRRESKAASYGQDEKLTDKLLAKLQDREQRLEGLRRELDSLEEPTKTARIELKRTAIESLEVIPRVEIHAVLSVLEGIMGGLETCAEMFKYEDNIKSTAEMAGRALIGNWNDCSHPGWYVRDSVRKLIHHFNLAVKSTGYVVKGRDSGGENSGENSGRGLI